MRLVTKLVVGTLVLTACAQEAEPTRTRSNTAVTLERAGSVVHDSRVGAAALVRVTGSQPRGPIDLELTFVDRKGQELATTRDSLPFCAAEQDCWWAATFFVEDYGGRDVARVEVQAGSADPFGAGEPTRPFDVRRDADGTIRGSAPGAQGTAYVVASSGDQRLWGTSVQLDGDASVTVPPDILPKLEGEDLSGHFYAGTSVPGD